MIATISATRPWGELVNDPAKDFEAEFLLGILSCAYNMMFFRSMHESDLMMK
jgi:hypothetical protein